ncbi:MAG: (Fe-S)-binding protein, partial [Planctomycetes bacterium]|nr:(Fe-S)-binding protein [Planctomycetota bacterium]
MKKRIKVEDISKPSPRLSELRKEDFKPLPCPLDKPEATPDFAPLSDTARERFEGTLDDTIAVSLPKPKDKKEEDELVAKFLSGLQKLFTKENNWTFLQPLLLSMDYCASCHTCSEACHIYEASGENPIYRPAYRSEVFR